MLDRKRKSVKMGSETEGIALGRQLTIEYYECDNQVLLDKDLVEQALLKAAHDSGATIISSSFHRFSPQGVSGVVVIAESHFTVHAWPEHDYAAVDIFSCGENINIEIAVNTMKTAFQSQNVVISSDQNRGLFSKPVKLQTPGREVWPADEGLISWKRKMAQIKPWGVLTSVDVYECEPEIAGDAEQIKNFVHQLCGTMSVNQIGEYQITPVSDSGATDGLRFQQPLENGLISGYTASGSTAVYLDFFSCDLYEPRDVAEAAVSFFKGENYRLQVALRQ